MFLIGKWQDFLTPSDASWTYFVFIRSHALRRYMLRIAVGKIGATRSLSHTLSLVFVCAEFVMFNFVGKVIRESQRIRETAKLWRLCDRHNVCFKFVSGETVSITAKHVESFLRKLPSQELHPKRCVQRRVSR